MKPSADRKVDRKWFRDQGFIRTDKDEFKSWVMFQRVADAAVAWADANPPPSPASDVEGLVKALEFYRDERNWIKRPNNACGAIVADTGARAKAALAAYRAFTGKPDDVVTAPGDLTLDEYHRAVAKLKQEQNEDFIDGFIASTLNHLKQAALEGQPGAEDDVAVPKIEVVENRSGEICPSCFSAEFLVARDMLATKHCIRCHRQWTPGEAAPKGDSHG